MKINRIRELDKYIQIVGESIYAICVFYLVDSVSKKRLHYSLWTQWNANRNGIKYSFCIFWYNKGHRNLDWVSNRVD